MRFTGLPLNGAFLIEREPLGDDRGYFARTFCVEEFAEQGLHTRIVQSNLSHNVHVYTLRGMHFQLAPHAEAKLVSCSQGAIFDVLVDLRPDSSTFKRWAGVELTSDNHRQVYIPEGFAHGFLTLQPDTTVVYHMFAAYHPASARGVRWNDPAFGIDWPVAKPAQISERDASYPDFEV